MMIIYQKLQNVINRNYSYGAERFDGFWGMRAFLV